MIYLATGSLLSGVALGARARLDAHRARPSRVSRRMHQCAYAASMVTLAAVTVAQWRHSRVVSTSTGAAVVVLTRLPRHSGWRRRHVEIVAAAFVLHIAGVIVHLANRRGD